MLAESASTLKEDADPMRKTDEMKQRRAQEQEGCQNITFTSSIYAI